ncbi:PH domain-containing protein [Thiotrichales bacterium HSG1]|nr:PH domain-containing protein [Thiotrichales bacterium HSG1]
MQTNLYKELEVSTDASQQEIKAAMMKLGKKYAVRSQVDHLSYMRFNQIKEAYKIISNPYKRANYDNLLRQEVKSKFIIFNITDIKSYFKKKITQTYKFIKYIRVIGWFISKNKIIQAWKIIKLWFFITIQTVKRIRNGERLTAKGWQPSKFKDTSKYVRKTIISSEKIIYKAHPHWLFYLDIVGANFFLISSYLLLNKPIFIQKNIPEIMLWIPWANVEYLKVSVWYLGLGTLAFIGFMVVWEAFVDNKTTELIITSRRIMHKTGLLNRTIIDLKLDKFESVTVKQTFIGRIFNYGTITITGMSKMQTKVHHIVAPLKFKKQLWEILEKQ